MSVRARAVGFAVIAVTTAHASVAAQQPEPFVERYWVSVGGGVGTMELTTAAFAGDIAYQRGPQLFALHATTVLGGYELSHFAASLGLVYGLSSTGPEAPAFSVATGLAFVQVDVSPELENTVGIPITVHASMDSPYVGFGVVTFANLNRTESYAGVVLSLRFGRLRRLSRSGRSPATARGPAAVRTPRRYPAPATHAPPR